MCVSLHTVDTCTCVLEQVVVLALPVVALAVRLSSRLVELFCFGPLGLQSLSPLSHLP